MREDLEEEKLHTIYRQMAGILLELSLHDFDKIGTCLWTGSSPLRKLGLSLADP